MAKRLHLTCAAGEWRLIKELTKRCFPYLSPTASAKFILLELSKHTDLIEALVTRSHSESLGLTPRERVRSSSGSFDSSSEKKRKEKKKRGGSVRGEKQPTLVGLEAPPISEPFVKEVVTHLNETCGTAFPPFDRGVRELVAALVAGGYTVEDIKTVNKWADDHWPAGDEKKKYWRDRMLVPSKLYGEKFAEHLGVARGAEQHADEDGTPWSPPADQMLGTPEFEARMASYEDALKKTPQ